jgi:shikimate kinase
MHPIQRNIVLIGMPGSGKSTVGVLLAKEAEMDFLDTDVLIQTTEARSLQDIVDRDGYLALRAVEERIILSLQVRHTVIATGGSAVYSEKGVAHLKSGGILVFIDVPLSELERRVGDFSRRGLAKRPDQSFDELYAERLMLYHRCADVTLTWKGQTPEQVARDILAGCRQFESAPRVRI